MASSSGNSMTSNSEGGCDLQQQQGTTTTTMMDERKRKRMASNRESARRSRMRKQKHLDDLMSQVDQLRKENNQILQTISLTTQQFVNVDAENSVLQAQMNELSQRLQSLNDIINTLNGVGLEDDFQVGGGGGDFGFVNGYFGNFTQGNNFASSPWNLGNFTQGNNFASSPWNLCYLNQPIMASADVLQY